MVGQSEPFPLIVYKPTNVARILKSLYFSRVVSRKTKYDMKSYDFIVKLQFLCMINFFKSIAGARLRSTIKIHAVFASLRGTSKCHAKYDTF